MQPAIDSPIQAESGQVLAETVHPQSTAAGEATCSAPELFNPLTAFKDDRDYFVAPAGDFEDPQLPGWQLEGGASLTDGGSTHAVIGGTQSFSLTLPPGSSATSPEMCVDLNYPTFRFFATQLEQDTDAELAVDVIYPGAREEQRPSGQEVQAQVQGRLAAERRHQARAAAARQAVRLAQDRHPLPRQARQEARDLPDRRRSHRSPPFN